MPWSCSRTLLMSLLVLSGAAALAQPVTSPSPLRSFGSSQPIADRYIVAFKAHVTQPAAEAARVMAAAGPAAQLHHVYGTAIKGFAATLPPAAVTALQRNPNVDSIEQDQTVQLSTLQNEATWGLDRIDQVDRPLDTVYQYTRTGQGVFAFILDTGIRADHVEFGGRVLSGYSVISDGRGTEDCDGHGTHVAGTVGSARWGVAKQVSLVPVRVLNCRGSGTWSGVIAGIDWVAASDLRPAVANMSLGGGKSTSVNAAVAGAVGRNVTMVVAAGNSNADACAYSPASEPSALTVGATTSSDARASYSNWGTCLDLFAPGSSITSAWYTSNTGSNTLSGTSMASPHVAGVSALVLEAQPTASPAAVGAAVIAIASQNQVSAAGNGSPNLLAYSAPDGTIDASEPPVQTVAVNGITGTSAAVGRNQWRATATVTIRNLDTNAAVSGATVSASFNPGGSGSCVTGSQGSCTIDSSPLKLNTNQTVFTVNGVSGSGMSYRSDQNSMSAITIAR